MEPRDLPVISLFSGALGLDLGLEQTGFTVRVAVESNRFAAATIRRNRPEIAVIERKIEDVTSEEILDAAGLKPGEPVIVSGGPSCQTFSTLGQRSSVNDPRGQLFIEFLRVVRDTRPQFFLMENVRGVLSAAVKHRPLNQRGPGFPLLDPDEEFGSAFRLIQDELRATGYYTSFDILNAADYGVPQVRERVIFIGSRDGEIVKMPSRTHANGGADGLLPWRTLREAVVGLDEQSAVHTKLSPRKRGYLAMIPEGGNWRSLPDEIKAEAMGKAFASWGGRNGFYRRLSWDRPAPALTTSPDSKATMFCHPTELRPLSVQEYARIQEFPDDWWLDGGMPQHYKQIGNAVPIGLAHALGEAIREAIDEGVRDASLCGTVRCADEALMERLRKQVKTRLNPVRMREVKSIAASKAWLHGQHYQPELSASAVAAVDRMDD